MYIIHTINSTKIIKRLRKEGWILANVAGSHHKFKHPTTGLIVTVPHPRKDFPIGTLRAIFKRADWDWK